MSELSSTRRELEASLRSFLPKELQDSEHASTKPTVAAVGVGGVVTGYLWGRVRGRRLHKARKTKKEKD